MRHIPGQLEREMAELLKNKSADAADHANLQSVQDVSNALLREPEELTTIANAFLETVNPDSLYSELTWDTSR